MTIFGVKRNHDDRLRTLELNAREDEYSKYHALLKEGECRIRAMEDERYMARQKYMETVENIQS